MRRRGLSLVEVLIASGVLVAVLVPLIGLMTSRRTDAQSEEGMSEGISLAENLMEKLLSASVPFDAIDPGGAGGGLVKGGPGGNFVQASFREDPKNSFGEDARADLEQLFWDGEEPIAGEPGNHRVKTVGEKTFYVSLFAGKYPLRPGLDDNKDSGAKRADVDQALTFGYLENPAGAGEPFTFQKSDADDFGRQIVLRKPKVTVGGTDIAAIPYELKSFAVTRGASPVARPLTDRTAEFYYKNRALNLPDDMRTATLIPGWQDPLAANPAIAAAASESERRRLRAETTAKVVKRAGPLPTLAYHPRVLDQQSVGLKSGGLMKLVLGVRFAPYQFSKLRSGDITREFWLVSFKADLEK